jgi:hypothetical protein
MAAHHSSKHAARPMILSFGLGIALPAPRFTAAIGAFALEAAGASVPLLRTVMRWSNRLVRPPLLNRQFFRTVNLLLRYHHRDVLHPRHHRLGGIELCIDALYLTWPGSLQSQTPRQHIDPFRVAE